MSEAWPTWDTLNAYIDGELSTSEAASVARAVSKRSSLADQIALLSRMKATVKTSLDGETTVELPPPGRIHSWPRLAIGAFVVALLAFFLVLTIVWWPERHSNVTALDLLDTAWRAHSTWAERSRTETADTRPAELGGLLPAMAQIGPDAHVPDLSSAGLAIRDVYLVAVEPRGKLLHVGYAGTQGCRLSLFVLPMSRGLTERLLQTGLDGHRAYVWRAGTMGYFLLASDMEPDRFALIAESMYQATRGRLPLTVGMQTALRRSRDDSASCLA